MASALLLSITLCYRLLSTPDSIAQSQDNEQSIDGKDRIIAIDKYRLMGITIDSYC